MVQLIILLFELGLESGGNWIMHLDPMLIQKAADKVWPPDNGLNGPP